MIRRFVDSEGGGVGDAEGYLITDGVGQRVPAGIGFTGDAQDYLTADEMKALFRLPSRRAVFDRVRRGTIPVPFRLGRTLLWERAEVLRFVEENRVAASPKSMVEGGGAR